jgi:hypothetical protein
MEVKFSQFTDGGEMMIGDIPVGLRPSSPTQNFQFNFPGSGILDSSGNYLLQYATVGALAVNSLQFVNSLTGEPVLLTAQGSDADISISIIPIGTGALYLDNLKWPTSDGLPYTFLYTDGAGNINFTSQLTNGQLFIGSTDALPVAANITAGTNVSITNGAGSITISSSGSGAGFTWTVVTNTSENMDINNGYITNNASLVTLNLPVTSDVGDAIGVIGKGAGGWIVQCGTGQTIVLGSSTTSSEGSLASTNEKDSFYMICTVANTEWTVASAPQSAGLTIT